MQALCVCVCIRVCVHMHICVVCEMRNLKASEAHTERADNVNQYILTLGFHLYGVKSI